jgi:hypothetical protein
MRLRGGLLLVACACSLALGGCRERDWTFTRLRAAARHPTATAGTSIPLSGVDIAESGYGSVSYVVHLSAPPSDTRAEWLVLRFANPLDGAKVQAFAHRSNGQQTLVRDKRVGGAEVEIPLGAIAWETVDVVVHNHLRPAGILNAVMVRAEVGHAVARAL